MWRWIKLLLQRVQTLWSFLTLQLYKKNSANSVSTGLKNKRRWIVATSSVVAVVFILLVVIEPLMAVDGVSNIGSASKTIMNWAIGGIAKMVVWMAEQLGYILIFLIDLLINIVQYNNFVNATPVQVGWPLIRDTVNMFFIVIVLVSAFATIIGYPQDFHYRKVLPKLLVMAILINFSKTIIGLMIDFSQVIVLTFVNGFKQAAGGNFVTALGIGKIMQLSATTGVIDENAKGEITVTMENNSPSQSAWSLMNILVASIFAIWIISISITLILIMLIFFLARIIMLWFLLITSPIAFFAWSLPQSIKGVASQFTSEWWSRLSAALVGGPTMAFFLWLSLAMAQRHTDLIGEGGLYNPDQASEEISQFAQSTAKADLVAPSEFGDPRVFATFIIMVAFMLVGVQTSVKFASSVAPGTEKLVGQLASSKGGIGVAAGVAAGRLAGRTSRRGALMAGAAAVGGAGLAYKGGKLAGKGALAVGREAEARYGIASGAAKAIQKDKIFAWAPVSVQKAISGVAAAPKKAAQDKAKQLKEMGSSMDPLEYQQMLDHQIAAAEGSLVPGRDKAIVKARKGDIDGLYMAKAQQAMSSIYQDKLTDTNKEKARAEFGLNEGDDEDLVTARAKEMTNTTVAAQLADAEEYAKGHNDEDMIKKIKEMREKNPALTVAGTKRANQAKKDASDTQGERKIKPEAFMDGSYALSYAHAKGWVDQDGRMVIGKQNDSEYKKFMGGKQGQYMSAHMEYAKTEAGSAQAKQIITQKAADGTDLSDAENAARYAASNYTVNVSGDGEEYKVVQNQEFKMAGIAGVKDATSGGRFDKTTRDRTEILRNADPRSKQVINQSAGAMGMVRGDDGKPREASVEDLGRSMSPQVAKNIAADMEALEKARNEKKTEDEIVALRSDIANRQLEHGISAKALFGFNAKDGKFADTEGTKAFQATMDDLTGKIASGNYDQKTIAALSALSKQIGTKGDGFKMMQTAMRDLNQGQILNTMNAGMPEQKKDIRNLFMNMVAQADRDRDEGKSNTPAMRLRESAIQPPPPGSPPEDFKRASAVHRILFEGK